MGRLNGTGVCKTGDFAGSTIISGKPYTDQKFMRRICSEAKIKH